MTMPFSQYIANRPTAAGAISATDKVICLQGGVVKTINPEWVPTVNTDVGGSGKRCQITARWMGVDDQGGDIWQTEVTTV